MPGVSFQGFAKGGDRHGIRSTQACAASDEAHGLDCVISKCRMTLRGDGHNIYPYLLGGVKVRRPD